MPERSVENAVSMTHNAAETTTKTCIHCQEPKPIESFVKSNASKSKDKRGILCADCRPRLTQREKVKYETASWRANNLERARAITYRSNIKNLYGLTQDQYDAMFIEQDGRCKICQAKADSPRALHVDHCHKSGAIRGLLCGHCNSGLGHFKDNIEALRQAIKYLREGDS